MGQYVGSFSDIVESQDFVEVVFFLDAKAAATEFEINAAQRSAEQKVYVIQGDGAVDLSSAKADTIVQNEQKSDLDQTLSNLSQGLQTYFTNIPAAADGVAALAFAVGGITHEKILSAELSWNTEGTSAANPTTILKKLDVLPVASVALNGSSQLLKNDGSTAIVAGTDTFVSYPNQSVIFGAFVTPDVLDVPAADVPVKLTLRIK